MTDLIERAPSISPDEFERLAIAAREAEQAANVAHEHWRKAQQSMSEASKEMDQARAALRSYVERCAGAKVSKM